MTDSTSAARAELAPTGTLRVALNMSEKIVSSGDIRGRPCRGAEMIDRTDNGLEGRGQNALIGPHTPADGAVRCPYLDVGYSHGA